MFPKSSCRPRVVYQQNMVNHKKGYKYFRCGWWWALPDIYPFFQKYLTILRRSNPKVHPTPRPSTYNARKREKGQNKETIGKIHVPKDPDETISLPNEGVVIDVLLLLVLVIFR